MLQARQHAARRGSWAAATRLAARPATPPASEAVSPAGRPTRDASSASSRRTASARPVSGAAATPAIAGSIGSAAQDTLELGQPEERREPRLRLVADVPRGQAIDMDRDRPARAGYRLQRPAARCQVDVGRSVVTATSCAKTSGTALAHIRPRSVSEVTTSDRCHVRTSADRPTPARSDRARARHRSRRRLGGPASVGPQRRPRHRPGPVPDRVQRPGQAGEAACPERASSSIRRVSSDRHRRRPAGRPVAEPGRARWRRLEDGPLQLGRSGRRLPARS